MVWFKSYAKKCFFCKMVANVTHWNTSHMQTFQVITHVIITFKGHQYRWLAGGYDLEIDICRGG